MSEDYDYKTLLKRARDKLPSAIADHSRFQVPELEILFEGKTTVVRNFAEIASAVNRDPADILAYLLKELGTAGSSDGKRVIFKGKVQIDQIKERLSNYVSTYVLCSECMRPDTKLIKDGRTLILECDACGAHRPVKVRKGSRGPEVTAAIEVGKTYDLMIQDVGRKGDGMAKKGDFIIYVPGTAKGSQVKVLIENISGTIAFGRVISQ
ncbi:MAG: translation initiation factor IF-2 subunit beta [Methanomassiliicoccales archaeon]|nr:MAG: translation initiation factor IF-2 subunit beta [Methanomassiliicoccales archaeon]